MLTKDDHSSPNGPARLKLHGLNKQFGDTQVLHDIALTILPGEIHGLAGQNGSGKSTVIKVLTGVYEPDAGAALEIDGRPMRLPVRWREVHQAGVSVVHQDLGILDGLSVAENVCVGGFPRSRLTGRIHASRRDELCRRALARVGATINPATLAADLTAAERAEVAIARALRDHSPGSGLIILDEATRALSGADLTRVHDLLRRIVAEGSSVLMISHNLVELADIADRVSVLRDGRLVADGLPMSEAGPEEIALYMLGRETAAHPITPDERPAEPGTLTRTPVRVTHLRTVKTREVSLSVAAGEIVGITGLPGSGYEEIPYALTGAQRPISGVLEVDDTRIDLTHCRPADCIRHGVVLIPERRDRDGLALEMAVRDNLCLPALRTRSRRYFLARGWQQQAFQQAMQTLGIKAAGPMALVRQLSGGNQQKVMLAKWLGVNPRAMVLHEPTQAVDVGARQDILKALQAVAHQGVGIVLVSGEAEDLVSLCNRVLIYSAATGLAETAARTVEALIEEIYRRESGTIGVSNEA